MLTVVLECQDQESELAQTLSVLVAGAVEGLVSDVIVLDHGSRDGTSRVADAAGCRFHSQWDIKDIVRSARGEWLLFVEPGARPQAGWIDEIAEYVALNKTPARFTASRGYRRPFFQRLPAVVEGLPLQRFEPPCRVQASATAAPAIDLDPEAGGYDHRIGNICRIGRRECGLPCQGLLSHRILPRRKSHCLRPF